MPIIFQSCHASLSSTTYNPHEIFPNMSQIDYLKIKSHPRHPVRVVLLSVGEQESGHQEGKGPIAMGEDGKVPVLVC